MSGRSASAFGGRHTCFRRLEAGCSSWVPGSWAFRLRGGFWLRLTTVSGRWLIVVIDFVVWLVVRVAIQLAANATEIRSTSSVCSKHCQPSLFVVHTLLELTMGVDTMVNTKKFLSRLIAMVSRGQARAWSASTSHSQSTTQLGV